jgi:hypothetical protein
MEGKRVLAERRRTETAEQPVSESVERRHYSRWRGWVVAFLAVGIFGVLCFHQYRLPGLYYDEAFDAVPAMQILNGDPVQLSRGVGIHLFGHAFPVMIGDYWGVVST